MRGEGGEREGHLHVSRCAARYPRYPIYSTRRVKVLYDLSRLLIAAASRSSSSSSSEKSHARKNSRSVRNFPREQKLAHPAISSCVSRKTCARYMRVCVCVIDSLFSRNYFRNMLLCQFYLIFFIHYYSSERIMRCSYHRAVFTKKISTDSLDVN